MLEFLSSWEFWVIAVIIFLIGIWFARRELSNDNKQYEFIVPGSRKRKKSNYTSDVDEEDVDEVEDEEVEETQDEEVINASRSCYARSLRTGTIHTQPSLRIDASMIEDSLSHSVSRGVIYDDPIVVSVKAPKVVNKVNNVNRGPPAKERKAGKVSSREKLCKEIAERIWNKKFISVRPDWLRNPETKRCLELDLYNEELGIGIECNGEQHYQYVPFFHKKDYNNFLKQVKYDNMKLDMCDDAGVWVITVPYFIPENSIERYIKSQIPRD